MILDRGYFPSKAFRVGRILSHKLVAYAERKDKYHSDVETETQQIFFTSINLAGY